MRVALVRPPEVHPYWTSKRPSLGVSYLASFLSANGIEGQIFDANFNLWNTEQTARLIKKYQPDLIGISSMTHEIIEANRLAGKLKNKLPRTKIVIGGCHLTALPKKTLEEFPDFDFGIYQEGEKPLLELVRYLENKKGNLGKINNLVYRTKKGKIKVNPPGPRLTGRELDNLPYPAFEQYYLWPKALDGKDDYYAIMSSRGCPYHCAFCMQVLGHQLRRRSPESIVKEIEYAINRFHAHTIIFYDEIFLFNDDLAAATLNLMIKRKLPKIIRWEACTRANLVDEKLIQKAQKAGCYYLNIGVESGSDEILKRIGKQITVEQVKQAVRIIKKTGLKTGAYFILGHPGETPKTIRQTVNLAVELNTDLLAVGLMVPYPGTQVYEMAKKGQYGYKLLNVDWSGYDKYGGNALELKNLSLSELEKWQRRMFLEFYLRNFRICDLTKFAFEHKKEIYWLLFKK